MDAALATFLRGCLPVTSAGVALVDGDAGPEPVAAVALDTTARPDVADLARVHAQEGVGDLRTFAGLADVGPPSSWLVRFDVAVDHPVRCRFAFVLGYEEHCAVLDLVARSGSVAVDGGAHDGWLALHVAGHRLADLLATADLRARRSR